MLVISKQLDIKRYLPIFLLIFLSYPTFIIYVSQEIYVSFDSLITFKSFFNFT